MEEVLHLREGMEYHHAFGAIEAGLAEISKRGIARFYSANSIWPQQRYRFERAYRALLADTYGVETHAVDYRGNPEDARATINRWVLDHTAGRIGHIISGPLGPLTTLILVNALYLKAEWKHQFQQHATTSEAFHAADGQEVEVDFMHQTDTFSYAERDELQALELTYTERDLATLILLPGTRDALADLEARLTTQLLSGVIEHLVSTKVEVFLPRFRVETALTLSATMRALGMVDAFDRKRADFSGMDGTRELSIAEAFHRTFVEVHEEGTEAAAVTAVVIKEFGRVLLPPATAPVFRADHPFLYLIRQRTTGTILFMGRVEDPSQGN